MDWNDYRKEINDAGFDPEASLRAARRAVTAWQERKGRYPMEHTKKTIRLGFIAACLVVVLGASALAAVASWKQTIRSNLGIEDENPIAEYTEYESSEKLQRNMNLLASVCSGRQMDAYFALTDVPEDQEIELKTLEFRGNDESTAESPVTTLITRADYNAENKTSLVRFTVMGRALEQAQAVNIGLVWHEEPEEDIYAGIRKLPTNEEGEIVGLDEYMEDIYSRVLPRYEHILGPVEVPVTESEILCATGSVQLSCGTVTEVQVGAGFVEITLAGMEAPGTDPDKAHTVTLAQQEAITAALAGATLRFADGTEQNIAQLASPWASAWVFADGEPSTGRVQHILSQMLDLRQVCAIELNGEVLELN